jgi:hypothetical protein
MTMPNINWFDGQNAVGKYVLELMYDDGSVSYMKNESYKQIGHFYQLALEMSEVVGATVYNPRWQVICSTARAAA